MNHWQNFYHDATAEELDDFVERLRLRIENAEDFDQNEVGGYTYDY